MNTKEVEYRKRVEALENAFEASYDGIHILDRDGKTILINKACERIEGITKEDIGEKTISQLVDEGYYNESVTLLVIKENRPVTRLQRVKNGREIMVTGMPIYGDNGEIVRVIVNSRDVTELMELKESLKNKEKLIKIYEEQLSLKDFQEEVMATNKKMKRVINTVMSVAKVDSSVLITGESGVGKSYIAEMIHRYSPRRQEPFVKIDCSAIPESLFESELFGYEGGAFTGADTKGKIGLVQMADRGTIFLDEIGEVSVAMQAKLLRFIQEKSFYRVGGKTPIKIDVRIISATNRNPDEMVKEKTFREDLLYRLNVIPIEIPPLRERREDIQGIILHFLNQVNRKYDFKKTLSEEVMKVMTEYEWPGNIREVENLIERVVVTSANDCIQIDDLPIRVNNNIFKQKLAEGTSNNLLKLTDGESDVLEDVTYKDLLDEFDYTLLSSLIERGYRANEIATILSIDATTVRRKLHKCNIEFK